MCTQRSESCLVRNAISLCVITGLQQAEGWAYKYKELKMAQDTIGCWLWIFHCLQWKFSVGNYCPCFYLLFVCKSLFVKTCLQRREFSCILVLRFLFCPFFFLFSSNKKRMNSIVVFWLLLNLLTGCYKQRRTTWISLNSVWPSSYKIGGTRPLSFWEPIGKIAYILKSFGQSCTESVQNGLCVHMKPQMQWIAKMFLLLILLLAASEDEGHCLHSFPFLSPSISKIKSRYP